MKKNLKKPLLWLLLFGLLMSISLSACRKQEGSKGDPVPPKPSQQQQEQEKGEDAMTPDSTNPAIGMELAEDATLIKFEYIFQFSGEEPESYTYILEKQENGTLFTLNTAIPKADKQILILDPALDILMGLIRKHELNQWHGFDETAPSIVPGNAFQLHATFSDGSEIKASGYNVFPDNYEVPAADLRKFFEQLAQQYEQISNQ